MKRDPSEHPIDKVRKTLRGRAEKACVRCRAKKRTCDGGNPCQRCKESHSACYFRWVFHAVLDPRPCSWEDSDWHYTIPYPREYVEYLEEQQEQLSTGLMTMYRLLKESGIQTAPALPDMPSTQELLTALRGLKLDETPVHRAQPSAPTDPSTPSDARDPIRQDSGERSGQHSGHAPTPMTLSSASPWHHPMYVPYFEPGHSPAMSVRPSLSSPMRSSYSPMPSETYEHPRQMQHQTVTSHSQLECGSETNGLMGMPQAWPMTPCPLSPDSTPMGGRSNQPTPLQATEVGAGPSSQQAWPWTFNGYGSAMGYPHDASSLGMQMDSIESQQRGDSVRPPNFHDSHEPSPGPPLQ
jgi:hypothetical protein